MDPDVQLLGGPGNEEFTMVTNGSELRQWVAMGKVQRPPVWDNITMQGDVLLQPGQYQYLLFKF